MGFVVKLDFLTGRKKFPDRACSRCSTMTSRPHRAVLAVLAAVFSGHAIAQKPRPLDLVSTANERSDLSKVLPHRLTGIVVLHPGTNNESSGTLTVYRDSDHYRSDIEIAGQHRTWLKLENKIYISDSSPLAFMGLEKLKDIENSWRERRANSREMKFGNVLGKKILGAEAWCLNANYKDFLPLRLCFDQDRRLMVTTGYEEDLYEFSNFQTIGGQQYPAHIRRLKHGKPIFEVRDLHAESGAVPEGVFEAPQSAREFEVCDDMVSPKFISGPDLFRFAPGRTRGSIKVFVYGIVAQDGTFGNVQVASVPHDPAVVKLVEEAASKRRYTPATCGGKPVATETYFEVDAVRSVR